MPVSVPIIHRRLVVAAACLAAAVLPRPVTAQQRPSLYTRLGGYDAIALVTDDFLQRMFVDPRLSKFFTGLGVDSRKRTRQLIVDQLCWATGGPCTYIGREMKVAHAGLGITKADWDLAASLLTASLAKYQVPPVERRELLALADQLKDDIIDDR